MLLLTKNNSLELLSDVKREKWLKEAQSIGNENLEDISSLLPVASELAEKYLPHSWKEKLLQINQPNGLSHLHLKGLPQDAQLPPTPFDGKRPTSKSWVSELMLLGIASYGLESEPFAYWEQKAGSLVQDVIPIKGLEKTNSNASSIDLGWHTDDACLPRPYRAEGLILYCLRNPEASTLLASIDEVVASINPVDFGVLCQPRFRVRTPDSFNLFGGRLIYSEPRAIIAEGSAGLEVAVALYNVVPVDDYDYQAKEALLALRLNLRSPVSKSIALKPGEILIISNLKGLHARDSIVGDRWLQRIYFRKDLNDLRQDTCSSDTCRIFSSEGLFLR